MFINIKCIEEYVYIKYYVVIFFGGCKINRIIFKLNGF